MTSPCAMPVSTRIPEPSGHFSSPHGAGRGREVIVRILRVQPGLHGVAELRRGLALESSAAGDEDLKLDQVEAGGGLGDRVLDL